MHNNFLFLLIKINLLFLSFSNFQFNQTKRDHLFSGQSLPPKKTMQVTHIMRPLQLNLFLF